MKIARRANSAVLIGQLQMTDLRAWVAHLVRPSYPLSSNTYAVVLFLLLWRLVVRAVDG